jgi:glucokinase
VTLAVGIDVGASKIAAGLVDTSRGTLIEAIRRPNPGDPLEALELCGRMAAELSPSGPRPVGIGLCELVAPDGEITSGVSVDWRDLDVASVLPGVRVESDVRAAAAAEARYGAARGAASALYLNIGSGISHCLLLDGVPFAGARGNALVTGAPPVEEWSSGVGLARHAATGSSEAALSDPGHAQLVEDAARRLGAALATLVNALDPELVVIGGGLGLDPHYMEMVVGAARPLIYAPATAALPIVPARLGSDAGVIGAAALAVEAGTGAPRART